MASQLITLFAIGGQLADEIETNLARWFSARQAEDPDEWSTEQWPESIHAEIDQFAERLLKHGFTPPIVYRSQHVDLWSAGDVFNRALDTCDHQLLTNRFQIYSKRASSSHRDDKPLPQFDEYQWLDRRIQEAATSWKEMESTPLLLLFREIMGGLWLDSEVEASLKHLPDWW